MRASINIEIIDILIRMLYCLKLLIKIEEVINRKPKTVYISLYSYVNNIKQKNKIILQVHIDKYLTVIFSLLNKNNTLAKQPNQMVIFTKR